MRRFGVSLEPELLQQLDRLVRDQSLPSRSEAIRHLVRERAAREEWKAGRGVVAGCLMLIYDHHRRELLAKLTETQHKHQALILSSQHVHLDHHLCMESILLRGPAGKLQALADGLCALKGVHHGQLSRAAA
jgi:CopG family nickel-responsive transcriptional regulator